MLGPSGGRETSAALMMNDPGRQYEYYYTFVVIPKVDDLFGRKVFAGCELEAVNLLQDGERIRCLYLPPSYGIANATEQADLIRDVATYPEKYVYSLSKVVGMLVSVLDEKVTGEAIDYATDRNLSVITFDSDAPQSTRLAYVGVNNSDVGAMIGKEMMIEDPRGGHYAIITGIGPNHELRIEAIRQTLRGSTWVESGSPLNCYENSTLAFELLSDLLKKSTIQGIVLTEAWPTYLLYEFHEIREKLSAKILVMGGYQSFAYYDVPSYIVSFGSDPEEIGRQSLQLLFQTTEHKQSIFPSLYTGYSIFRRPTVWIGFKGNTENFSWGGYSDDVWKGCVNKGILCENNFYTDAQDQAKAIIGASRFSACIAVSVLDENVTGEAIDIAVDRGVRVITFESDAPHSKRSAYVGVNDFDYGVKLGEKMKEKAMKSKQPLGQRYVIITDQAPNSKLRIHGIRAALKDSGWVEGEISPSYVSHVEELQELAENPEIDGFISTEGWPMDNATFYRIVNSMKNIEAKKLSLSEVDLPLNRHSSMKALLMN
jgi:ABC-type sugar transport system substrate-binding protein